MSDYLVRMLTSDGAEVGVVYAFFPHITLLPDSVKTSLRPNSVQCPNTIARRYKNSATFCTRHLASTL